MHGVCNDCPAATPQSLLSREADAALAGGVNMMLDPITTARICLLQARTVTVSPITPARTKPFRHCRMHVCQRSAPLAAVVRPVKRNPWGKRRPW